MVFLLLILLLFGGLLRLCGIFFRLRVLLIFVVLSQVVELVDDAFVLLHLHFGEWAGHALLDFFARVPLISIALWVAQEVKLRKFAILVGLQLADNGQVPFAEVILSVENHAFLEDLVRNFLRLADVAVGFVSLTDDLVKPAEVSKLTFLVSLLRLFHLLLLCLSGVLLRPFLVGEVDEPLDLVLDIDTQLLLFVVIVVLTQVALQCFDGAAF